MSMNLVKLGKMIAQFSAKYIENIKIRLQILNYSKFWSRIIFKELEIISFFPSLYFKIKIIANNYCNYQLKNEIKRVEESGSKEDVSEKTKNIVEELTGHPYEEMWPDE